MRRLAGHRRPDAFLLGTHRRAKDPECREHDDDERRRLNPRDPAQPIHGRRRSEMDLADPRFGDRIVALVQSLDEGTHPLTVPRVPEVGLERQVHPVTRLALGVHHHGRDAEPLDLLQHVEDHRDAGLLRIADPLEDARVDPRQRRRIRVHGAHQLLRVEQIPGQDNAE